MTQLFHFIGKLIGCVIMLTCALGLFILFCAIVGCTDVRPTKTYAVSTPSGSTLVRANTYRTYNSCVEFITFDGSLLGRREGTFCGVVGVVEVVEAQ